MATLLETSVVSVKSTLQRARATLAASGIAGSDPWVPTQAMDVAHQDLLDHYVDAVERWDIDALVALLHEDATVAMPPHAFWLRGVASIHRFFGAFHSDLRVLPTTANGSPGFALYHADQPGGPYDAFDLQVVETSAGRISAIHCFLDPGLFPLFDLPARLSRVDRADEAVSKAVPRY